MGVIPSRKWNRWPISFSKLKTSQQTYILMIIFFVESDFDGRKYAHLLKNLQPNILLIP